MKFLLPSFFRFHDRDAPAKKEGHLSDQVFSFIINTSALLLIGLFFFDDPCYFH